MQFLFVDKSRFNFEKPVSQESGIYCSEGILLRGYSVKDSMVETVAPEEGKEKFVERIWEASTS